MTERAGPGKRFGSAMEPRPNTTAPAAGAHVRVRVRRRRRHFSAWSQFGIDRKDMLLGLIVVLVASAAAAWFLYRMFVSGSGGEPGDGISVPAYDHDGATRFR